MNTILIRFLLLLSVFLSPMAWAQTQAIEYSTPRPRIDDISYRAVIISRVDLTAEYTIVYMRYSEERASLQRQIPGFSLPQQMSLSEIHFVPTARLYANEGARSFKFIRAENIPTTSRRNVRPGEQVDFVAYFERLDPGIEVFDLYECSDRRQENGRCFNFWGVHVINPLKRQRTQPQAQARAMPPARTVPRTTPAPTPRNAPAPRVPPAPIPEPAAPILAIKGVVRDAKTGKPVAGLLTYRLLSGAESNGGEADSVRAKADDGTYRIPGESLTVWAVNVTAKGYFGQRDTIAITRADKTINFDLTPIVVGTKVTLKNIYFAQSKYDVQAESYPELNQLVAVMKTNPTMHIRLEGHTDIIGDFDANLELSRNRVNAVKRYLAGKGIADSRIEAVGYGHSRPINSTRGAPHPENRRVEMVITKV